jgi:hypothetical protein
VILAAVCLFAAWFERHDRMRAFGFLLAALLFILL